MKWNAQDFEDRGGTKSARRGQDSLEFPSGPVCLLSTQLLAKEAGGGQQSRLIARFQVSENGAWCVGLVPDREKDKKTRYLQDGPEDDDDDDDGKRLPPNGWNNQTLYHDNELPEKDLHEKMIEIEADAVAGTLVLRYDGVELKQEITEELPAHLVISGNQETLESTSSFCGSSSSRKVSDRLLL